MKLTLFWIIILCTASALQGAQDNVNVRLSAISLSGRVSPLFFETSQGRQELKVYQGARSKRVVYKGGPVIQFYHQSKKPITSTDSSNQATVLGRVALPAATGDFLLLFVRDTKAKQERYRIIALPDDLFIFKPGMYRFINLAPFNIALKLGKSQTILKKGDFTDVQAQTADKTYQEAIMYSMLDEKNPYRAYKGGLYYSSDKRRICIISPKTGGREGRIALTMIPEAVTEN